MRKRPSDRLKRALAALSFYSRLLSDSVDLATDKLLHVTVEVLHAVVKLATLVAVIKFLITEISHIWA